jgi:hypothetical protein
MAMVIAMDHFIHIPVDQTGTIPDPALAPAVVSTMMSPFDFSDIFIYSHGWWTSCDAAMSTYTRFSLGFVKELCSLPAATLPAAPVSSLGIGIHWPSVVNDDIQLLNTLEPVTFYKMERRSDSVGQNAVFALLVLLLRSFSKAEDQGSIRITLLGHSFGCRVICSALQRLYQQITHESDSAFAQFCLGAPINLVLLQAACDSSSLEAGAQYGNDRR